jgi:hypothetical protein
MDQLKTLFDIRSEETGVQGRTLLLEVGQDYCSYAFLSDEKSSITQIGYVSFDAFKTEESLQSLLQNFSGHDINKAVISSGFPQSLFVPQPLFKNDHSMLDVVYDQPAQEYCHDVIGEWQIINLYSLPKSIYRLFSERFGSPQFFHVHTPSLRVYNGFINENQISVHFNTQDFRVLVKTGQQLQLAQIYQYQSPLDVVYYLLKICYEFGIDQSSVYVILSGLVEADSSLYKEIHQYFLEVHFAAATTLSVPAHSHPQYYFTSLYNLAACVS